MSTQAHSPEALHELGVQAAREGRLDEAEGLLQRAVAGHAEEPTFHSNLGSVLHAQGKWDEAAAAHERAIELAWRRMSIYHYNLGSALQAQGKLGAAGAAYARALEHDPGFVQALDNLGTVLQGQGKLDEAEAAYRRALDLEPGNVWVHGNLGSVLCAAGKLDEAEAVYANAVALAPEEVKARLELGMCLRLQGKLDAAEAVFRGAAELAPGSAEVRKLLGTLLLGAGRAMEAEAEHCRAVELAPEVADMHNALGATLAVLGRFDDAVAAFQRAIELAPGWAQSRYNLGAVLHRQNELGEAVVAYRAALEREPGHREALNNLAEALRRLGRAAEAREAYVAALQVDPDNAGLQHMLAAVSGETSACAPAGYIAAMFDDYAPRFDEHLVRDLEYRVPVLMREAIERVRAEGNGHVRSGSALDLGCGTGLVGAELRPMVDELHGVDLSVNMIAEARAKGLYDALHMSELVAFLRGSAATYDLITAADVFIYIGDLEPVFAAAHARLRAGGLLVFSVESMPERAGAPDEARDYVLCATGRYAHDHGYIHRLCREHGFAVALDQPICARYEHGEPVRGLLFVLARSQSSLG